MKPVWAKYALFLVLIRTLGSNKDFSWSFLGHPDNDGIHKSSPRSVKCTN